MYKIVILSVILYLAHSSMGQITTRIPAATATETLTGTRTISGAMDFRNRRLQLNVKCNGHDESQAALLFLRHGAHIKNLIVGANNGNGIVCEGTCTLENVFWEDVCEDAATMRPNTDSSVTMTVIGGAAFNADDKVFQHNGAGRLIIRNFYAKNIGKLARSCGTCASQPIRGKTFDLQNVRVDDLLDTVVGLQRNMGDRVVALRNVHASGNKYASICKIYDFQNGGRSDPKFVKNGPEPNVCTWGSDVTMKHY